jgi:hypothetical protein
MMQTYTVHIETVERYTITVDAESFADAEEKAWRLFPHYTPDHIENNVVEVVCNEQPPV